MSGPQSSQARRADLGSCLTVISEVQQGQMPREKGDSLGGGGSAWGQEGAAESQGREGMGLLCCLLGKLGLCRPEERSKPKRAVSRHRSCKALRSSRTCAAR